MKRVYVIVGATYPFPPAAYRTKRAAQKALVEMRRNIRNMFACESKSRRCGIAIESRSTRDYLGEVQS